MPYRPRKNSFPALIKPLVALADNIIYYISNLPDGKNINVVIFDRFIPSTQIKLKALNYNTGWFSFLWKNFRTDLCFVLDVPEKISVKRQIVREADPYFYTEDILKIERNEYFKYAKKHGFKIITNKNKKETKKKIINHIKEAL